MKNDRQAILLEIIEQEAVETQEQLLRLLAERGVKCTQATVSRDIKQLHLVKEPTGHGRYRYAVSVQKTKLNFAEKLRTIFRECVLSVASAQNLVVLKTIEGTAKFMSGMMKDMFKRNFLTKLAALACRSGIQDFKKKMDYRETGGTLLLGLRKPVVKAHGSSDELAFYHAVRQAVNAVEANITQDIQDNIEKMAVPKELEHADET